MFLKKIIVFALSFLLLATSLLDATNINLSSGISVDTNSKPSLLGFDKKNVLTKKYFDRYGLKDHKIAQFYVELEDGRNHDEMTKLIGAPENIIDEKIAIYSTSIARLKALDPKLMKWVGFVKPHHKFSVANNNKKPFNSLPKLYKNGKFKFLMLLSNKSSQRSQNALKDTLSKGFAEFCASNGFKTYNVILTPASKDLLTLEIVTTSKNQPEQLENVYNEVLSFFADRPEIIFIERALQFELLNIEAYTTLQSGLRNITGNKNDLLYRNGVTGANQIVQVTDTGLDTGNCLFYDKTTNPSMSFKKIMENHRKVQGYFYNAGSDTYDSANGHGTHVSGTVAGSMEATDPQTESAYHGVAYDAKIFMFDVQDESTGGLSGITDDPTTMFNEGYKAGARIFTNSWGYTNPYDCSFDGSVCYSKNSGKRINNTQCIQQSGRMCQNAGNKYGVFDMLLDKMLYSRPDIITLFAAGNDGRTAPSGTVHSPATSKNTLTVGASDTSNAALVRSFNYEDYSRIIAQLQWFEQFKNIETETDCCNYNGTSYEIIRSLCCAVYAQKALSALSFVYNETNLADFSGRGPVFDEAEPFLKNFTITTMRIKPDVVAPGNRIVSAHANGKQAPHKYHCEAGRSQGPTDSTLIAMQGTSMSTPAMAGGVALIRQFFSQNLKKFSIGYSSPNMDMPSGPLLKALAIHAAQPLTGAVLEDGATISLQKPLPQVYPNIYSGFGQPDLSYIIPFKNEQLAGNQPYFDIKFDNLNYFLKNPSNSSSTNKKYSFRLFKKLENSGKFAQFFRATLAYYDAPSNPNTITTETVLEGDIDLVVEIPSKNKTYYGNGVATGDRVNTVEQIMITGSEFEGLNLTPSDEIIVSVRKGQSGRFNPDYVPFSVVVSSTYSMTPPNTCFGKNSNDTANVCNGRGTCTDTDTCSCSEFGGNECEIPICFGVLATNSQKVCSGNGECLAPNKCKCYNNNNKGFFYGPNCANITPQSGALLRTNSKLLLLLIIIAVACPFI